MLSQSQSNTVCTRLKHIPICFIVGLTLAVVRDFYIHCKSTVNVATAIKNQLVWDSIFFDITTQTVFTSVFDSDGMVAYNLHFKVLKIPITSYLDIFGCSCTCGNVCDSVCIIFYKCITMVII